MDWHQIAKGLKHLIVTVASPRNTVQEIELPGQSFKPFRCFRQRRVRRRACETLHP